MEKERNVTWLLVIAAQAVGMGMVRLQAKSLKKLNKKLSRWLLDSGHTLQDIADGNEEEHFALYTVEGREVTPKYINFDIVESAQMVE